MSNIIGEPFNKYVADQVLARQKLHGSAQRDNSILSYLNSKTAYIKLTSGVMVQDRNRLSVLGIPDAFLGTQLAKNCIMFSGISDIRNTLNSDISRTETFINEFAYGFGGLEMGLRPMPGIISMESKYRNRGSIREGTILIKAFNRKQFEILSLLYLRLGFPILLEWGHTIHVRNDNSIDLNPNYSISNEFLDRTFKDDNSVLDALEKKRKESNGNYDAMYGRVVNFDWKFTRDGVYNITLKIISVGAVVESLKMNVYTKDRINVQTATSKTANDQQELSTGQWIIKYRYSHNIGNYFYQLKRGTTSRVNTHIAKRFSESGITTYINKETGNADFLYTVRPKYRYYIRLGSLLEFIQKNNILNNVDNQSSPKPLVNIDYNTTTNFMYADNFQISSDPRVCLVGGFSIKRGNEVRELPSVPILTNELSVNPYKSRIKNVLVGLPMNIYLECGFVLQKMESLKDSDGDVSLSDLLNGLLEDINKALGGTNQLEFIMDENVGKIIDSIPIPGIDKLIDNPELASDSPMFNIFGYYSNNSEDQSAGFIREFSLKTEITNGLATMLTIGSTANSSVVGGDATAFTKWNNGLLPIINQNIAHPDTPEIPRSGIVGPSVIGKFHAENRLLINAYYEYIQKYNTSGYNEEDLDSLQDVIKNYLDYIQQLTNLQNNTNKSTKIVSPTCTKGFLPISLQLSLDGLSGIKIYQKLKVDTSYLPVDYPTILKFIIKGVNHKVNAKGWVIDIDTVSVPVIEVIEDQNKEGIIKISAPKKQDSDNRGEARNFINADNLRKTLNELGYTEKNKELTSNNIDITVNIEKSASHVLRTIKKELPNLTIMVTGGNDKFHKEKSPSSRHTKGNAIDFTISPVSPTNLDAVVSILRRYAAGNSPNFRYIDEYRNISIAGTGNHFHISYGAGTEGQTALNESIKLAQEGKIKPIKIA
jgi:hypothetical protein